MIWKRVQSQKRFPTVVRWAKSPLEWAGIDPLPPELSLAPMKINWNQGNFHGRKTKFGGKRIDSGSLQWAFCSANHSWKSFLTLNSFPAHMRYFKNLKSTWHKNLSCSCQLQTIFWSLTPHLHVLIIIWNVYVSQKDGVKSPSFKTEIVKASLLQWEISVHSWHRLEGESCGRIRSFSGGWKDMLFTREFGHD